MLFYVFSPLFLLLSLHFPGFVFYNHFKEKNYFNLNKIIFGFLCLTIIGTFFSIISFDLLSNQKTWIMYWLLNVVTMLGSKTHTIDANKQLRSKITQFLA